MADEIKKYCEGLDCGICDEKEPCIYKIANELEEQLKAKEQECEELQSHFKQIDESNKILYQEKCELLQQLDQLKAENEQLKEELSVIQHNCNREGCKYYDDDTFKVFYECKAQKALQLSANSVTTKYCDLLQILAEIKEIVYLLNDKTMVRKDICDRLDLILQEISEVE